MQYARGTGGGPYIPPPTPKTDEEKELLETIKLSVEGLNNIFDSDGMSGSQGIAPEKVVMQDREESDDDMVNVDWSTGSATLWQTPKHPSLKAQSRGGQEIQAPQEVQFNFENDATNADRTTKNSTKTQANTGTPSLSSLPVRAGNLTNFEDKENNMVECEETNINSRNINDKHLLFFRKVAKMHLNVIKLCVINFFRKMAKQKKASFKQEENIVLCCC